MTTAKISLKKPVFKITPLAAAIVPALFATAMPASAQLESQRRAPPAHRQYSY
mgnify:CR=1 FL=1